MTLIKTRVIVKLVPIFNH